MTSAAAIASLLSWLGPGCASIPDVSFVDPDASQGSAAESTDGTSSDGGEAADAGATDAAPGGSRSCPDVAPKDGICCEGKPCINCSPSSCDDCRRADCKSAELCCATRSGGGGSRIQCRSRC